MSIFKSLDSIETNIESTPVGAKFSTIEYSFDSFLKKIEDGTFSDLKIRNTILSNYSEYLNYDNFKNPDTRIIFQSLWTNERFLRNFLSVFSSNDCPEISGFYLTGLNKIAYDYYAIGSNAVENSKESIIRDLLIEMVAKANIRIIIQISTVMNYH